MVFRASITRIETRSQLLTWIAIRVRPRLPKVHANNFSHQHIAGSVSVASLQAPGSSFLQAIVTDAGALH